MAKQPLTPPGKLSELARHVIYPTPVSTGWPAVRDKCRDLGVVFDPWQDGAGRIILSKNADGSYCCSIGGVVISIPRQVGKTFLIGAIVFALCMLTPGLTVIWTAHHTATANETFQSMQGLAKRRRVAPHVDKVLIDAMTVLFRNESRVMFGARERGFGRGFTKVGVLVFDEAQILTERAAADMVPTTNTVENALVIYTGTPPKPADPSELFTNRRAEALAGDSDGMAYIEFSADRGANPDDRKQWAKANPSYPSRTNAAAMLRMRKNLTVESYLREALGIWDEDVGSGAIPNWADLRYVEGETVGIASNTAWALAVSPVGADGQWASLGKAGRTVDGFLHIECIDRRKGTRWIVPFVKEQYELNGRLPLRVHRGAPEGAFIDDLKAAGIEVEEVNGVDEAHATGQLIAAAAGSEEILPTLRHLGDPFLDKAVANAELRTGPDGGAKWDQRKSSVDISPLRSVTVALGGVPAEAVFAGAFTSLADYDDDEDWED